MYSMRKFTALQYAMFMVAALAVLVAVPSAYADTVNVDPLCADTGINTPACDDGTTYPTIQSAITAAADGDTISISNATNHQAGTVNVNKPLTIEPAANERVILNGPSRINVNSDDVTIQGITFKNTTSHYAIHIGKTASGVTIHNNTFADTRNHGIFTANTADTLIRNLNITDNVFKNIGTFYPLGYTLDQKADHLKTPIFLVTLSSTLGGVQDSKITGNTIDTSTLVAINLAGVENILVQNNTISNVPATGIVLRAGENVRILDNRIRDASNTLQFLNGHNSTSIRGAIGLWGEEPMSHVTVSNNTISGGNNGIYFCTGICGVNNPGRGGPPVITDETTKIDGTIKFTHNTFDNIKGFDIINRAVGVMVATHNYYGTAVPDFTKILSGDVHYNPYYADPERMVLVDDGKGTLQKSIADLAVSPVCSISLGTYIMDFDDAKYGATSSIVQNQIKNAGNQDLGGIKFTSAGWLKPDKTPLPDAVSKVGTDVTSSASYTPITTAPAGVNFDNRNFTGPNTLPASGSSGSALVGFVLDLSRVATGADVTVTESVTYSATCS